MAVTYASAVKTARITATAPGRILFDVIGTFSDGTKDGPQVSVQVL